MVPFPVPLPVMVHHAALLLAVHCELDETVKVVAPAGAFTFLPGGVTDRVGATAAAVNEPAIPGA